jgi:hypothetical protein
LEESYRYRLDYLEAGRELRLIRLDHLQARAVGEAEHNVRRTHGRTARAGI